MAGLNCISCEVLFNSDNHLPLVLPCGDSICMECILRYTAPVPVVYKCPVCWRAFSVSNHFVKDLPKNKAILMVLQGPRLESPKHGPSPRILPFSTPEAKRNYASPEKLAGYLTPSTHGYSTPLHFSTPNSVKVKCAREGCNNDRYYMNGEIWEYCCINCRDYTIYPRNY